MNLTEYEYFRSQFPELKLPEGSMLNSANVILLLQLSPTQLYARRTARLLSRQFPEIEDPGSIYEIPLA